MCVSCLIFTVCLENIVCEDLHTLSRVNLTLFHEKKKSIPPFRSIQCPFTALLGEELYFLKTKLKVRDLTLDCSTWLNLIFQLNRFFYDSNVHASIRYRPNTTFLQKKIAKEKQPVDLSQHLLALLLLLLLLSYYCSANCPSGNWKSLFSLTIWNQLIDRDDTRWEFRRWTATGTKVQQCASSGQKHVWCNLKVPEGSSDFLLFTWGWHSGFCLQ